MKDLKNYARDTIAALSTPKGVGAIGIIRISGSRSLELLEKTVKFKKTPTERTVYFGNFFDSACEIIDEVMYVYFKAPRSYTGEDMVEIYCHGGILVTDKILDTIIKLGARLAENGEFTKRAFLNGKMDLIKAESVLQIIEAKSETGLKLALENLKGKLSSEVDFIRSYLLDILSKIEVSIDYGDDVDIDQTEILNDLKKIKYILEEKLKDADKKLHLTSGITLAIVGKPNVGKSTLLNRLLMEDRAIVTDIPGTTRDIIKGEIKIGGVHFVISDTAGIRETEDTVEKIGIERALNEAKKSDVIIFVLDATTGFTAEDEYIYNILKDSNSYNGHNIIFVWNKTDISDSKYQINPSHISDISNISDISEKIKNSLKISAYNGFGMRELEKKILEVVQPLIDEGELAHITSLRQLEHLKKVKFYIDKSIVEIERMVPIDIVSISIRESLASLDELTGRVFSIDLVDNIFSKFCVGK